MSTTKKLKASDRQAITRKLITVLKKKYGGSLPRSSRSVLETLLFAACLENAGYTAAEKTFDRMLKQFHDLNEIRVSSISEIEQVLADLSDPDWKALRIRETLQHTFEKHYSFDLEAVKRKTMDAAVKQLAEIRYLTPFMRTYVLQQCLGSHVVPIDDVSREVLVWLGLVDDGTAPEAASDEMKSSLKKQDAPLFLHLLRAVATDPKYAGTFSLVGPDGQEIDATTAPERLKQHMARPPRQPARKKLTKARRKPAAQPNAAGKKTAARRSRTAKVTKKVSRPKKKATKRRVKHK